MENLLGAMQRKYAAYVDGFRKGGELSPMMRLKWVHTAFVVGNANLIARSEGFAARERELGNIAALLHDTGRYEQLLKYDTFRDADSVDHAVLSHRIVSEQGWLDAAALAPEERAAILNAVLYHNRKDLPAKQPPLERKICEVVRDADKLDIFNVLEEQVRTTDWKSDCKAFWGLPAFGPVNPAVAGALMRREAVHYRQIKSLADFVLIQVGWMIGGLAFSASRRMCAERGHLEFRRAFLAQITADAAAAKICDLAAAALRG